MNRVIPASTGSSNTMSAAPRPVWGRDSGRFSTLTASAGRFGTSPPGAIWPVNGHRGGSLWMKLPTTPPRRPLATQSESADDQRAADDDDSKGGPQAAASSHGHTGNSSSSRRRTEIER